MPRRSTTCRSRRDRPTARSPDLGRAKRRHRVRCCMLEVGRHRIGVFRVGDEFFALADRCPHRGAPLCSAGEVATPIEAAGETLAVGAATIGRTLPLAQMGLRDRDGTVHGRPTSQGEALPGSEGKRRPGGRARRRGSRRQRPETLGLATRVAGALHAGPLPGVQSAMPHAWGSSSSAQELMQ